MRLGRGLAEYIGAAALLGLVWCAALLIPEAMRNLILDEHAVIHVMFFPVVSILIASLFRRPITKARSGFRFVILALILPFVGTVMWYVMATMVAWFTNPPGTLAEALGTLIASIILLPTAVGMVAYAAYYIVIPMGLLSQYVMNAVAQHSLHGGDIRAAT